ncbi:hypothetical protein GW796_08215 [archaeon]|nr:hypothetical protein [archaeon]
MKTNHQRNFKSSYNPQSYRTKYVVGGNSIKSELADRTISAAAYLPDTETLSAKKRTRENKAGAKKYVRTRVRFHENDVTKKLSKEYI